MKKEKPENYSPIPNEILEALSRITLPGECSRVLHFILRKIYGWHKTEDWISLNQFVEGTKLTKPHISRAITKLIERNIIIKTGNAHAFFTKHGVKQHPIYSVQMNFKKWIGYQE